MRAETKLKWALGVMLAITIAAGLMAVAYAQTTYTRDGGTADFACCADKWCVTVITQRAREWSAKDDCVALTNVDGVTRYVRQWPMRVVRSGSALPVEPPETGSATIRWTPPTQNSDGTALTDLAGYRIRYGTAAGALNQTIDVTNAALSSYVVTSLTAGTWYFAVASVNSAGAQSADSNVASRQVP